LREEFAIKILPDLLLFDLAAIVMLFALVENIFFPELYIVIETTQCEIRRETPIKHLLFKLTFRRNFSKVILRCLNA